MYKLPICLGLAGALVLTAAPSAAETPPVPAETAAAAEAAESADPTEATEAAPAWRLSGYATLGHASVRSSAGATFARDLSQSQPRGWEVDTRVGLQLDGHLTPTLGVTAQALWRPRVPGTPAAQSLEWGFAHWTPRPGWQLRVGRTSPDLFLYADVRSVGIAFPWVRLNSEFYAWMPVQSLDGLDLTRDWAAGMATWRLKLGYAHGQVRVAAQSGGTPGDAHLDAVRLLTLSRETVDSRIKFSLLRGQLDLARAPVLRALDGQLAGITLQAQLLQLPTLAAEAEVLRQGLGVRAASHYVSLGAQQDLGPWQLTGEWSRSTGSARQTDAQRHTLSVARRFDALTAFVVAGRSRMTNPTLVPPLHWAAQLAPRVGAAAAAQATGLGVAAAGAGNQGRNDQRSIGLGLRWDLAPRLAAKLQWDRTRVAGQGSTLWSLRPQADDDRPFTARVLSVSLDASF